ncbi:MAG: hypothetical protein ACOY3K_02910 [Candidatus Omnitrophota bacterium]
MAQKAKELYFTMPNKVGQLSRITDLLKRARVNILHIAAWSEGSKACFQMVTSHNAKARKALRGVAAGMKESEVLVLNLGHKVGALDRVAKKLARAGVNIACLAATTRGKRASVLVRTNKNAKAARLV